MAIFRHIRKKRAYFRESLVLRFQKKGAQNLINGSHGIIPIASTACFPAGDPVYTLNPVPTCCKVHNVTTQCMRSTVETELFDHRTSRKGA